MPSTFTTRNRAEKQGIGENNNGWGTILNGNVIDMFDEALDGMVSFTLSGTKTLSTASGATDEARKRFLNVTGGTGGTITIPNLEKLYFVRNQSSGNVVLSTGSGTTGTIPTLTNGWAVCEGGNVCRAYVIQPWDNELTALSGVTAAANQIPYFTSATAASLIDIGAWSTSSPTPTPSVGSFTSVSCDVRYKQIGKTTHFHCRVQVVTNGTAAGTISVTLPATRVTTTSTDIAAFCAYETQAGTVSGVGKLAQNTATLVLTTATGTYIGGTGTTINCSGTYEAA